MAIGQVVPYQIGHKEEGFCKKSSYLKSRIPRKGKIMEEIVSLLTIYEWASGIGGVLQVSLILLKRTNNLLMALGVLLDAIGLAGMSFGFILQGEKLFAAGSLLVIVLDVAFVLYIIYKDEHPQKFQKPSK